MWNIIKNEKMFDGITIHCYYNSQERKLITSINKWCQAKTRFYSNLFQLLYFSARRRVYFLKFKMKLIIENMSWCEVQMSWNARHYQPHFLMGFLMIVRDLSAEWNIHITCHIFRDISLTYFRRLYHFFGHNWIHLSMD